MNGAIIISSIWITAGLFAVAGDPNMEYVLANAWLATAAYALYWLK